MTNMFRISSILISLVLLITAVCPLAQAGGGVYPSTQHGSPQTGVMRDPALPRGNCSQCHYQHNSNTTAYDFALFTQDDNALCFQCHTGNGANLIYMGSTVYNGCLHGDAIDPDDRWPGPTPPARVESGASGKCLNCHDPHGYSDVSGLIPSQTFSREENLCSTCHDGSPVAPDIRTEITKVYHHPAYDYSGRHSESEDGTSSKYGYPSNRHSECTDCHNPHYARNDPVPPTAPAGSKRIRGVGRVEVTNGAAWTIPTFTYRSPVDTTGTVYEYQFCFKCHSSWTTLPPTQGDKGKECNSNNPSYHPVEAAGKNTDIDSRTLVSPWTASSKTYCSDCHRSDNTLVEGPHGSIYQNILFKDYYRGDGSSNPSTDNCFSCHVYEQYRTDTHSNGQTYTHFRKGTSTSSENLHYKHATEERTSCNTCHDDIHGSDKYHLITFASLVGGSRRYDHQTNGGSCYITCHGETHNPETYNWR